MENKPKAKQHLKEAFPTQNSYKEVLNLDLSPDIYNILNLDELEKDPEYRTIYAQINFLDISKNSLSVLRLKSYNNLERIIARENYITKVELNLPRLKKIDLSCNMINKMFELNSVTCLEELILNRNSISKITFEDFKPVKSTLVTLEIANNKVEFGSVKGFFDFSESFGKSMKKLKNLNISGNLFTNNKVYRDYTHVFLQYCQGLKTLNSNAIDNSILEEKKDINTVKNNMIKSERTAESSQIKEFIEESDQNIYYGKSISLEEISEELEKCNSLGKFSQSNVQILVSMIDNYLLSSGGSNNLGNEGKDEDEIEDLELNLFENIIEYTELLINSNESLEKLFIELVLKFSLIKNGKFASKSLSFLKSRLSPEKAKDFEEVLNSTVLEFIINTPEDDIHQHLIGGCESFLIDPKFYYILSRIVPKLIEIIINYKNMKFIGFSSENKKKKQIYLESISFLVQANNDESVISQFLANSVFIDAISIGIKNILFADEMTLSNDSKGMSILTKQLLIVKDLCLSKYAQSNKVYLENIMKMVGSGLKDKLEQALGNRITELEKKKTDDFNVENKENLYNKKLIFANLMRSYGAILRRTADVIKYLTDINLVPSKIINLLVQNVTYDPVLIASACDFVLCILNNEAVISNKDKIFDKITKKLFNLRYILPFIGYSQEEFKSACFIAEIYGDNTIVKGKPIELKSMTSKIMHNLFCSIINLIQYYQKYSILDFNIKLTCASVCTDLNEQNRDTYLCNALSVPNEYVKLSSVECLYWVESDQFSVDEIAQIYSQVKNISLIGGVIEKVVSIIFLFLAKCFKDYMSKTPEKVNQNKEAFTMAFDLLQKNLDNFSTSPVEIQIKNNLSISIITFLVNLSCFPQIKKLYLDRVDMSKLGRVIANEAKNYFFDEYFPIEIEKCRTGFSIDNIYNAFNVNRTVNPYSYVMLRIYIHMADILMNIPYKTYDLSSQLDFDDLISKLKVEFLIRESERIKIEKENFYSILIKKRELIRDINENSSMGLIFLDENELAEEQQRFLNILPELFSYLLGRSDKNKITYFETCWTDKFDKKFEDIKYSSSTYPKEFAKKDNFVYDAELKEENMVNVISTFKNYLREEEYYQSTNEIEQGSQHDYILKDLQRFYEYGRDAAHIKRMSNEENPHNHYLRTLVIASFLRMLYALLEFPANPKIKEQTISLLFKGTYIKDLSQLIDSTKLVDCNISTKYLIIMRYLLSNSKIYYVEATAKANFPNAERMIENEFLNKLGIISYTIKKIIKVFKNDLKLENTSHKLLLSEISIICLLVSNELENINFTDKLIKEQTLQAMISFDLIKVFINAIKENMNYESNLFKNAIGGVKKEEEAENNQVEEKQEVNLIFQEDHILITMMYNIANIIGEYMSKCKEYSYSILEMMTRSYIFEKVNFRKTYLKEIIECNRFANLKSNLEPFLKRKVYYAARVSAFFYLKSTTITKLLVLSETGLEFMEPSKSDRQVEDYDLTKFKFFEEFTIPFNQVEVIVVFEFEHRCLIKKLDGEIVSFFFYKANTSNYLIQLMRFINSKISIYKKVKVFDSDKQKISKVIRGFSSRPMLLQQNNKTNIKKQNMQIDTITPTTKESPQDEVNIDQHTLDLEMKLADVPNNENENTVILFGCVQISHFFDFISELFADSEFVPDGKVLVIKQNKIYIYKELPSKWEKIDFKSIFENNISYDYTEKESKCIFDFASCYKLVSEFDLSEVKQIKFKGADEILFNTDGSNQFTVIKVSDDISFLKLKRSLIPAAKNKGMEILDDPYSVIK